MPGQHVQAKAEALFPAAATSTSRACSLEFDDQDLYTPDSDEQQGAGAAAAPADDAVPEAATGGDASQTAMGTAPRLPGVPLTVEFLASVAQPETLAGDAAAEDATPDGSLAGDSSLVAPPLPQSPGGTSWWVPLDAEDAAPPATEPPAEAAATDALTKLGGADGTLDEAANNSGTTTVSHSVASLTSTQDVNVLSSSQSLDCSWPVPPPTLAEAEDPFEASAADPVLAAMPLQAATAAAASAKPAAGRGLHQMAVSAPVPAHNAPSAGGATSNDSPRRCEPATIQLSNSAPASPAASQASSGTDDWTVVGPGDCAPEASSEVGTRLP